MQVFIVDEKKEKRKEKKFIIAFFKKLFTKINMFIN